MKFDWLRLSMLLGVEDVGDRMVISDVDTLSLEFGKVVSEAECWFPSFREDRGGGAEARSGKARGRYRYCI